MNDLATPDRRPLWFARGPWLLLLIIAAAVYYGSYYRHGINFKDEGGTVTLLGGRILHGEVPFRDVELGYNVGWFLPIAGTMWLLGALGYLPRVKRSTKGEGHERRYFYGSVWAVAIAHPVLWLLWKTLPQNRIGDGLKLVVFVGILAVVAQLSRRGRLPRTRPIVPGEWAVSD